MNTPRRFVATRQALDGGGLSREWYVLDLEADENVYVGPMKAIEAVVDAQRWNDNPNLHPSNPQTDYTKEWT